MLNFNQQSSHCLDAPGGYDQPDETFLTVFHNGKEACGLIVAAAWGDEAIHRVKQLLPHSSNHHTWTGDAVWDALQNLPLQRKKGHPTPRPNQPLRCNR